MLSYDQARNGNEFHIAHDGLRCTTWRKAGPEFYPTSDGGWMMLVMNPETGAPAHLTDADVNAGDYHVPAECPRRPVMPTTITWPSAMLQGAYHTAPVIAAIPLDTPDTYAVTATSPLSPPDAPAYVAAEVTRNGHGSWIADEVFPAEALADALSDMASLAGRVRPRFL